MGEKSDCQMEVIVPELFKINDVGEKKQKITLIWVIIRQCHMVQMHSPEINGEKIQNKIHRTSFSLLCFN